MLTRLFLRALRVESDGLQRSMVDTGVLDFLGVFLKVVLPGVDSALFDRFDV